MKHFIALTGLLAGSLVGLQAHGAEREGAVKDAWIDGKLEAVYALNSYLSAFAIDTAVTQGVVQLTGKVSSDIDRDLAGELAKGIEGVVDVHNDLAVVPRTGDAAATATAPRRRKIVRRLDRRRYDHGKREVEAVGQPEHRRFANRRRHAR